MIGTGAVVTVDSDTAVDVDTALVGCVVDWDSFLLVELEEVEAVEVFVD